MFRQRHKRIGQITGEYVLTLFIVVGAITALTVYVKRGLQGRIRDAGQATIQTIRDYSYLDLGTPQGDIVRTFNGILWKQYEPYYGNRLSQVHVLEDNVKQLLPGATSGIYRETLDERTMATTVSSQAPPGQAQ